MSRIVSVIAIITIIGSLLICTAPAVNADIETIPLDQSINIPHTAIEAHLSYMEIGEDRKSSTKTTTPLERVKWVRLFYKYENHGDTSDTGNLNIQFIDEKNNAYNLDEGVYTGENVAPHSNSSLQFVEIPVSKDSNIVTIRIRQGFDYVDIAVPQPGNSASTQEPVTTPTTTPSSTIAATAKATTQNNGSAGGCLPFLPFAIIGGIGGLGMVVNKYGLKR